MLCLIYIETLNLKGVVSTSVKSFFISRFLSRGGEWCTLVLRNIDVVAVLLLLIFGNSNMNSQ